MIIRWTEKASSDALGIFDYIANQSPTYAESVYERILERPLQLTTHLRSGSIVSDLVLAECADGDGDAASERLKIVEGIDVLQTTAG